ncbi:PREDICTED: 50S ribosomal protein L19, chloroplastic-like [Nicotiana attenuata]|uniref:50s ribosomal protein l19-1, chloroplastic n=1 Tax=Nicotiana attenuata TaxID=49451 RepID=A0A1J6ILF5_NICAT|nr:PREDICTED: 50S ribosomal protein L19, chloroplastic-like [Nicotiana attenuata]OIS99698.1 50s ribosomal protein l19-1, chloroplastic [Nicotiana attenuata]
MGSVVFPQALFVVPRNPTTCKPKKLAFSACVCRRPSQLNLSLFSHNSMGLSSKWESRSFVVRAEAEADSQGEPEAAAETEEVAIAETAVATEERPPFKPRAKLGDIMGILNKQAIEASDAVRPIPDIRTGDVVEIKLEVPENRRRLSIYKGIVISKQNAGIHTTIRIRRIIAGIGVEIVFPVYSPNIKELKVVKHRKVRRARLYYLRDKLPRLSTFK